LDCDDDGNLHVDFDTECSFSVFAVNPGSISLAINNNTELCLSMRGKEWKMWKTCGDMLLGSCNPEDTWFVKQCVDLSDIVHGGGGGCYCYCCDGTWLDLCADHGGACEAPGPPPPEPLPCTAQTICTADCPPSPSGPISPGDWTQGDLYNGEETYTNDGNNYVVWWSNTQSAWIMSTGIGDLDGGSHWENTGNAFNPGGTFDPVGGNVGTIEFTITCPE